MPPGRATVPYGSLVAATELFRADGLAISSNSNTVTAAVKNQVLGPENLGGGLIDISAIDNGLLVVKVGAASGTAQTLNFQLDMLDAFGNWGPVAAQTGGIFGATPITAAGVYAGQLASVHIAASQGRLQWVVGGTTPDFTGVSINVYGR